MDVALPDPCLTLAELQTTETGGLAADRLRHLASCVLCSAAYEGFCLADAETRAVLLAPDASMNLTPFLKESKIIAPHQEPMALEIGSESHSHAVRTVWLWPGLAMAASIVVGVVLLANLHRSTNTSTAITGGFGSFEAVVEPFARRERGAAEVDKSSSDEVRVDAYRNAATAYEQGDYVAAADAYSQALASFSEPLHDTRGYYELGITHWKLEQLDSAAAYLTRARMGESEYFEDASWALAQVYLLRADSVAARIVLGDLAAMQQSPYAARAIEILNQL